MDAIQQLNYRLTLGDLASTTGLALGEAQQHLLSLAQQAEGHLQVAESGDIVYVFPKNFQDILTQKRRQDRWEVIRNKLWQGFLYGLKLSFGILLIVSIILISLALIALLTMSKSNDNNSRRSDSGPGIFWIPNIWVGNPFWSPYPSYYDYYGDSDDSYRYFKKQKEKPKMNFLEAVYSFLFGDGNPNSKLEEKRDQMIAATIRNQGGVIIGEQVLPFLDVDPKSPKLEYEDYMLPILVKFGGQPEVSEKGNIIYRFPELQITGSKQKKVKTKPLLEENLWTFSHASSSQLFLAGSLGVLNFVLASVLFSLRSEVAIGAAQGSGILALVNPLIGFLMTYGALFLAVPLIRWFTLKKRNTKVILRNRQRELWLEQLNNPDPVLQDKLAFASEFSQQEIISEGQVIYSTDKDLIEQRDYELDRADFKALEDKTAEDTE
jgi:hypothetical protein